MAPLDLGADVAPVPLRRRRARPGHVRGRRLHWPRGDLPALRVHRPPARARPPTSTRPTSSAPRRPSSATAAHRAGPGPRASSPSSTLGRPDHGPRRVPGRPGPPPVAVGSGPPEPGVPGCHRPRRRPRGPGRRPRAGRGRRPVRAGRGVPPLGVRRPATRSPTSPIVMRLLEREGAWFSFEHDGGRRRRLGRRRRPTARFEPIERGPVRGRRRWPTARPRGWSATGPRPSTPSPSATGSCPAAWS